MTQEVDDDSDLVVHLAFFLQGEKKKKDGMSPEGVCDLEEQYSQDKNRG